jgi:Uma2 family endonuclease
MAVATQLSVEEYLALDEKPYFEYDDGVLTQKAMPTAHHSRLTYLLVNMLEKQGALAFAELTIELKKTRFLIPDVCVVAAAPESAPEKVPPLLCIEVLSPSDRLGSAFTKCEEYHDWGVEACWVLDPTKRKAWEYPRGGDPRVVEDTLRCRELTVVLEELFAGLAGLRPGT